MRQQIATAYVLGAAYTIWMLHRWLNKLGNQPRGLNAIRAMWRRAVFTIACMGTYLLLKSSRRAKEMLDGLIRLVATDENAAFLVVLAAVVLKSSVAAAAVNPGSNGNNGSPLERLAGGCEDDAASHAAPPRRAECIIAALVPANRRDAALNDLEHRFESDSRRFGVRYARFLYWLEVPRELSSRCGRAVRYCNTVSAIVNVVRQITEGLRHWLG